MLTLKQVRHALELSNFDPEQAHLQMMPIRAKHRPEHLPGKARVGGVLVLLYCSNDEMMVVLTHRRDDLSSHPGQISFPGGRQEPSEPIQHTALRETFEEIGVDSTYIEVIGQLAPLYILPSDFEVFAFVAWYQNGGKPAFKPNPAEVAEIIEVPLSHLLDPSTRQEGLWQFRGHEMTFPFFAVDNHRVWGATAMMLNELVGRLRTVFSIQ